MTQHMSVWVRDALEVRPEPVAHGLGPYDVIIVGGGITGLTTATELKKSGKKVCVLEAGVVGQSGTTCSSSAHATVLPDTSLSQLINTFGAETISTYLHHLQESVTAIGDYQKLGRFSNDYRVVDNYLVANGDKQTHELKAMADAARLLNLPIRDVDTADVPLACSYAVAVPNQAQFNPAKHVLGLASYVQGDGCDVHSNTRVVKWEEGKGSEPCHVITESGIKYTANALVLATHQPIGLWPTLQTRMPAYRSYCLVAKLHTPLNTHMLLDTCDEPYYYVRDVGDLSTVLVGGCDHVQGAGDPTRAMENLELWSRAHLGIENILFKWSSNLWNSPDGMPVIGLGPAHNKTYIATGYAGVGLTQGTLAGHVISSLITTGTHPLQNILVPRISLFQSAMATVTTQAHAGLGLARRFLPTLASADKAVTQLAVGQGTVVRKHGELLAVHRKDDGTLGCCSGVCPHMGCAVTWNTEAKSWDCPCHGSTYTADGKALSGPTQHSLAHKEF